MSVAFFAVLEIGLLLGSVQPVLYEEDPYVGFSSYVPLFVEQVDPHRDVTMVTADNKVHLFTRQQFPRRKQSGTFRIFCLGGSTTYGRPYGDTTSFCGWLRELLPEADRSRQWQLINAGGISYASYRVAMLMEELIDYEPDLFIIYSGQNEFLERRTYENIIRMPTAVRGLGALAARTRTFAVMRRIVSPRKQTREKLPDEVATVLDDAIGPDDYHRDDRIRKQVLEHYRYNLLRMVDISRSAGARVILVTPASNLRHCAPFKSQHRTDLIPDQRDRWQTLFERAQQAYDNGTLAKAITDLDAAAEIDGRHADLHYLRGQVLYDLQQFDQAKEALQLALDEDVCPLRALGPMRQIVHNVGAERGVPVVDFVQIVEAESENHIPGEDLFLDHVHPTIEGNRMMAVALVQAMAKAGIVQLRPKWGDAVVQQVARRVEAGLDTRAHGLALRNLSQVLGWAGKHDEARKLAERAAGMVPDDAESYYRAGASALHSENLNEAIRFFRQALDVDASHAKAHNKLGVALLGKRDRDEAQSHFERAVALQPDYAEALNNLGVVFEQQGDVAKAAACYERAVSARPNNARAHYNLAGALEHKHHLKRAASHYRRAIELKSDYAQAYNNLGLVMERQRRHDEALQLYRQALEIKPDYVEAHANAGTILLSQRKRADAIRHFQRALEIQPDYIYARDQLRKAQAAGGR